MATARGNFTANTSKIGRNWTPHSTFNHVCMGYWNPKHIKRKKSSIDKHSDDVNTTMDFLETDIVPFPLSESYNTILSKEIKEIKQ